MLLRTYLMAAATAAIFPAWSAPPEGPARAPMFHTSWTARDGAPPEIRTMTQSSDGWMWFPSGAGLFRFDGVQFEAVDGIDGNKLLSSNVLVAAVHNDQLWMGYQFGGISVFEHGKARHYGEADGLPAGAVFRIDYDINGTMWMSGSAGIAYLDQERWHPVNLDDGATHQSLLFRAPSGQLWVQNKKGLYQCGEPVHTCRQLIEKPGIAQVMFKPDDGMWLLRKKLGLWEYSPATGSLTRHGPDKLVGALDVSYIDHRGVLWMGTDRFRYTLDAGLQVAQSFSEANGLSHVPFTSGFDDREGNVWFITRGGVDRTRLSKLTAVDLPKPFDYPSVVAADNGAVWITTDLLSATIEIRSDGGRSTSGKGPATASYREPNGAIWYGREHEVVRFLDGKTQHWPLPADIAGYPVQAITMGPDGELWVSVVRHGVHVLKDGHWSLRSDRPNMPASAAITMLTDPQGRVWLGYPQGRLAVVDRAGVRLYTARDGMDIGNVLALSHRFGRLWVGGEKGLFYFADGRFRQLLSDDGHAFKGVSGIVETLSGELWLHGTDGISRIVAADLKNAMAHQSDAVHRQLFDYREGLQGGASQIRPLPSLIEAGDGRIWYSTNLAVGWIDPGHIRRNLVRPSLTIRGLQAGGKRYATDRPVSLPAATDALQIDYTALSFTMPERVRFRYRLDGVDQRWQDAGTRRTAFYNSLGPGEYRFRVSAVNEDDVASAQEATLVVRIAPTLTQSLWFRALMGVLALASLWCLHVHRLRRVAESTRGLLEARIGERGRIARELHDTLLQSMQATILKVHATALSIPHDNPALRQSIDETVTEAQHALAEGRDRIQGLRAVLGADLGQELLHAAAELQAQFAGPRFDLKSFRPPRALHPIVHEELLAMAREALLNAFRHADAGLVSAELHYDAGEFRIVVRDDGAGIPADVLRASGRAGHWGMVGIKERAGKIGAKARLAGAAARGTAWTFSLPAALAYSDRSRLERLMQSARRRPH